MGQAPKPKAAQANTHTLSESKNRSVSTPSNVQLPELIATEEGFNSIFGAMDSSKISDYFTRTWSDQNNPPSVRQQINSAFSAITPDNDVINKISDLGSQLVATAITAHQLHSSIDPNPSSKLSYEDYIRIDSGASECIESIMQTALAEIQNEENSKSVQDNCKLLLSNLTTEITLAISKAAKMGDDDLVSSLIGTLKNALTDDLTEEMTYLRTSANIIIPIFASAYQALAKSPNAQGKFLGLFEVTLQNAIKAVKLEQSEGLGHTAIQDTARVMVDANEKDFDTKGLETQAAKYDATTKNHPIYRAIYDAIRNWTGSPLKNSKTLLQNMALRIERFGGKVRNLPVIRQSIDKLETATVNIKSKIRPRKKAPSSKPKLAKKTGI